MQEEHFIRIMGTAGARFAVAQQLRSSAGTFIHLQNKNLVLDPGPGTLVKLATFPAQYSVNALDAILLTHAHIDHSNDVNILIDAMTNGGLKKRGVLFAPRECIEGENAVVLKYLRGFLQDIVILKESSDYNLGSLSFHTSIRHRHGAETYGIVFDTAGHKVCFMVDTRFFPELLESYRGSELLIMNVVLKGHRKNSPVLHLSAEDARVILQSLQPERAVLTHFGMSMLETDLDGLTQQLSRETGVNVIAAQDNEQITIASSS